MICSNDLIVEYLLSHFCGPGRWLIGPKRQGWTTYTLLWW